jgi:flagellar basal body-associated protein FliL
MLNRKKTWLAALMIGVITLTAIPAFARSINLKDAGATLWIFIIIGAVIVLLQLIPAAILLFSFVGTSSSMIFKRGKEAEEEAPQRKSVLPGIEPAAAKK